MHGEQRCHQRAGPETAGHLPEDQEQHDGRGGVQQDIGPMVPAGAEPIELAVQLMRETGERMPVRTMAVGKDPGDAGDRQPVRHVGILINVFVIIIVDELVADRLAEDQSHRQQKQAANGRCEIGTPSAALGNRGAIAAAGRLRLPGASADGSAARRALPAKIAIPVCSAAILFSAHGIENESDRLWLDRAATIIFEFRGTDGPCQPAFENLMNAGLAYARMVLPTSRALPTIFFIVAHASPPEATSCRLLS